VTLGEINLAAHHVTCKQKWCIG